MKHLIKVMRVLLAVILVLSLCGCGEDYTGPVREIGGKKVVRGAETHFTLGEGCGEDFNLQFFVTEAYDRNVGTAGIYMKDMDSGVLYDDSFLNWDLMVQGDSFNMDTRETALMVLFICYADNMDLPFIWADSYQLIPYTKEGAKLLSNTKQEDNAGVLNAPAVPEEPVAPDHGEEMTDDGLEPGELTIDADFVYEQAKLLNIQLRQVCRYHCELKEGPILDLLVFLSTEFEGQENVSFGSPEWEEGRYVLDLTTNTWYDVSFVDQDVMFVNGTVNYADPIAALMLAVDRFNCAQDHSFLVAQTEQHTELDAKTLEDINQKLLIDQLTRKVSPYPYASVDEEPRKLSDEEIAELCKRPACYVKSVISTVSDAIAYLDLRFPTLYHGGATKNSSASMDYWLRSAPEILTDRWNQTGRTGITSCISYLLDDDYEINSLIAFWPSSEMMNEDEPQKTINYIKTATGYIFFDPVLRMQGDAMSRWGDLLPQSTCSSVAEYIEIIRQTQSLSDVLKYIFSNAGGVRMSYHMDYTNGYTITTATEGIEMVYYSVPAVDPAANVKPENIHSYQLASLLGGVTLTAEEAYGLVDAAPEVVREKVKTAADVLMYMLAAKTADSHGCKCTDVGGHTWHWNMSAKEVMENRLGNCGACANLANYLLDGDYEEVGFVDQAYYPGQGGSHIYTYVRYQDKYYILDYSWYIFTNYNALSDYPVTILDSLEQWPDKAQQIYGSVCLVMVYDTPGMQYPVIFGEEYEQQFGGIYYILPEGVDYIILYEAADGYQYYHIPFDTSAYNWNVFW